ncbi:MAG TPA: hypothetical protein VF605_06235 [Allosphingosinicella sp.]|jgi:hypothetical protein
MTSRKEELSRVLVDEAARAKGVSPLAARLLGDDELDWISGAGTHGQTGGSYSMQSGNSSYTQTGGSFAQGSTGSYYQGFGDVTQDQFGGE